jgi:patched 1 protein
VWRRAEALQSILQLMGEKEMFEYWSQTYRVHNLDWSQEKAALILDAWQRKFTQVSDFNFSLKNSQNFQEK